jgi:membrane-associated phospholipid phosphatase
LLVFFLAYYTALTRISDYMHHWSDVLGGAVLGSIVCFFTVSVYSFLLFFTAKSLLFGLLIEFHSNGG